MGSAMKFCAVADGRLDFYPKLGPTMEWDTAAGDILVLEAGGEVYQFDTKAPLQYNKPELLNPHFLASGPLV
jgi:3'(2'), 5'-bisphosphate nucleotidase